MGQRWWQRRHLHFYALPRLGVGGRGILKGNQDFLVQKRRKIAVQEDISDSHFTPPPMIFIKLSYNSVLAEPPAVAPEGLGT